MTEIPAPVLAGRRALVTGAARGIGRAIATGLAVSGAQVVCGDVDPAAETVAEIERAGGQALAVELDISQPESVDEAVSRCEKLGGLDILVNNAGIFPRSLVLDMDLAMWDEVIGVNLRGTFVCCQRAARLMTVQGRGGRILNVTSGAAFVPTSHSAHYAASKAGIVALTRVLALELAPQAITANALAPGLTDTAQPRSFYSEDQLRVLATRIPAGRLGDAEDMVGASLLVCSDAGSYITGQTLHVNGGLYMP